MKEKKEKAVVSPFDYLSVKTSKDGYINNVVYDMLVKRIKDLAVSSTKVRKKEDMEDSEVYSSILVEGSSLMSRVQKIKEKSLDLIWVNGVYKNLLDEIEIDHPDFEEVKKRSLKGTFFLNTGLMNMLEDFSEDDGELSEYYEKLKITSEFTAMLILLADNEWVLENMFDEKVETSFMNSFNKASKGISRAESRTVDSNGNEITSSYIEKSMKKQSSKLEELRAEMLKWEV